MLSTIVITKNESSMIGDCLTSLDFSDEIIVVDTGNTDNTNAIAKKAGAKIVKSGGSDYSQFRNDGQKAATGDWVLYLDADERVPRALKAEIQAIMKYPQEAGAFAIPRQNNYLGKYLKYGGWGGDYVIRLFKSSYLLGWHGVLHEQPSFKGELKKLTSPIIHFSHRDLSSMTDKTLNFTAYEAKLIYESGHPPITWWRFYRMMLTEFLHRFVRLSAWRDGTRGIIDGLFQVFNTFIIYARVWELQQNDRRHL